MTSPQTTPKRSQSSPAKFKEHYSHLTYSSKRTKEDDEGTTTPLSKSNSKPSFSGASKTLEHLKLPPLKLISGFAISEDGYMMSRFVSPPRFGLNNFEDAVSASGSGGKQQQHYLPINTNPNYSPSQHNRVFTATVSRDANGNARISIPRTAASGARTTSSAQLLNEGENNYQSNIIEQCGGDPWLALLRVAEPEGLTEADVALLEWSTVGELLAQFQLSKIIIENPVMKAKCELMWRKAHDKVLFDRLQQAQQQQSSSDDQKQNPPPSSIFAPSEAEQQQLEFKHFVEHLYPPSPIMQAPGGPVILVRTAPQGEILVNPSGGSEFSPRLKNQDYTSTFEQMLEASGGENTFVHHRQIPDEKRLFGSITFGKNPESSPLKKPALVKQVPKQTLGKRSVV